MSKKCIFLLVSLMALCSKFAWSADKGVLMLTAAEEEARCELIYSLNGADSLNRVLYDACEVNQLALIDRDIAMIQKHSSQLLVNKELAKGYWRYHIIPGCFKLAQIWSIYMVYKKITIGTHLYHTLNESEALVVAFGAGSVLIEAIKAKFFSSAYRYYVSMNKVFVKEMQRRWEKGQEVIAQLNGIKQKVVNKAC